MLDIKLGLTLLAILGCASAQTNDTRLACNATSSMDFDANKLSGIWYEVARNPAPTNSFLCVAVNFTVTNSDTMLIDTTYSNTPAYPWVNQTMTAAIDIATPNPNGYNISYENGLTNTSYTVFKLLDTDYTNYAFICGYQNVTNENTYFGIVLTRNQTPSTQDMLTYESLANQNYAEFLNGTMPEITQSSTCYANGALKRCGTSASLLAMFGILMLQMLLQ